MEQSLLLTDCSRHSFTDDDNFKEGCKKINGGVDGLRKLFVHTDENVGEVSFNFLAQLTFGAKFEKGIPASTYSGKSFAADINALLSEIGDISEDLIAFYIGEVLNKINPGCHFFPLNFYNETILSNISGSSSSSSSSSSTTLLDDAYVERKSDFIFGQLSPEKIETATKARQIAPGTLILKKSSFETFGRDIDMLKPNQFISDNTIMYFLDKHMPDKKRSIDGQNYFFDPLFIERQLLNAKYVEKDQAGMFENNDILISLRKWYRKNFREQKGRSAPSSIFDCKNLFFPINIKRLHWALVVVTLTKTSVEINYYDSAGNKGASYMDSTVIFLKALQFLEKEVHSVLLSNRICNRSIRKIENGYNLQADDCSPDNNSFGCGIFIICFAICIIANKDKSEFTTGSLFSRADIERFRILMTNNIIADAINSNNNNANSAIGKFVQSKTEFDVAMTDLREKFTLKSIDCDKENDGDDEKPSPSKMIIPVPGITQDGKKYFNFMCVNRDSKTCKWSVSCVYLNGHAEQSQIAMRAMVEFFKGFQETKDISMENSTLTELPYTGACLNATMLACCAQFVRFDFENSPFFRALQVQMGEKKSKLWFSNSVGKNSIWKHLASNCVGSNLLDEVLRLSKYFIASEMLGVFVKERPFGFIAFAQIAHDHPLAIKIPKKFKTKSERPEGESLTSLDFIVDNVERLVTSFINEGVPKRARHGSNISNMSDFDKHVVQKLKEMKNEKNKVNICIHNDARKPFGEISFDEFKTRTGNYFKRRGEGSGDADLEARMKASWDKPNTSYSIDFSFLFHKTGKHWIHMRFFLVGLFFDWIKSVGFSNPAGTFEETKHCIANGGDSFKAIRASFIPGNGSQKMPAFAVAYCKKMEYFIDDCDSFQDKDSDVISDEVGYKKPILHETFSKKHDEYSYLPDAITIKFRNFIIAKLDHALGCSPWLDGGVNLDNMKKKFIDSAGKVHDIIWEYIDFSHVPEPTKSKKKKKKKVVGIPVDRSRVQIFVGDILDDAVNAYSEGRSTDFFEFCRDGHAGCNFRLNKELTSSECGGVSQVRSKKNCVLIFNTSNGSTKNNGNGWLEKHTDYAFPNTSDDDERVAELVNGPCVKGSFFVTLFPRDYILQKIDGSEQKVVTFEERSVAVVEQFAVHSAQGAIWTPPTLNSPAKINASCIIHVYFRNSESKVCVPFLPGSDNDQTTSIWRFEDVNNSLLDKNAQARQEAYIKAKVKEYKSEVERLGNRLDEINKRKRKGRK